MPTQRPRHQVTETSEVERALDEASRRWPHESRSRLLTRLVVIGGNTLRKDADQAITERRARLDSLAGSCTGMYEPGYLDRLRGDWPA